MKGNKRSVVVAVILLGIVLPMSAFQGEATVKETVVMRSEPSVKAERTSCVTWTQMCATGPCGEERISALPPGMKVEIKARSNNRDQVGRWNNYWYRIWIDKYDCRENTWVFGEFLQLR